MGFEQTPGLKSKHNKKILKGISILKFWNWHKYKWTNKDYEDLENTLRDFIPLIRFSEISSNDFYDKIHPYKRIIPNQIYDEITSYHSEGILPETINVVPRTIPIEST